jgi:hypothetical protein
VPFHAAFLLFPLPVEERRIDIIPSGEVFERRLREQRGPLFRSAGNGKCADAVYGWDRLL